MKTLIPLAALAALVASSFSFAQTPAFSKPSGYTTQILKPNVVNHVGFNVLTPSLATGTVTAISGVNVTLSTTNLTSVLPAGKMFTIEISGGNAVGAVREFNSFTSNSVTISTAMGLLRIGDKFIIRKNPTLQEMFPAGAPLTGAPLNPVAADLVRIPNGSGGYDQYWYKTSATGGAIGWWTTIDGSTAAARVTVDIPLLFTDGILINRKAGAIVNLVLTGDVKTTATVPYIVKGYQAVSINPPVGLTLFGSGLSTQLTGGATTPATADILWVPNGNGGTTRYWYKTTATDGEIGWWTTTNGTTRGAKVTGTVKLPSSVTVQRRGNAKFVTIKVPSNYSKL